MDKRDPRQDAWWIGISYIALLIPCAAFFLIAQRYFGQPPVFALGVPIVAYILLTISMTVGYMKYYSTALPVLKFNDAIQLVYPFVSAALFLAIPASLFTCLAIYAISKRWSFCWVATILLAGNLLAVLYFIRVIRLKKQLGERA